VDRLFAGLFAGRSCSQARPHHNEEPIIATFGRRKRLNCYRNEKPDEGNVL